MYVNQIRKRKLPFWLRITRRSVQGLRWQSDHVDRTTPGCQKGSLTEPQEWPYPRRSTGGLIYSLTIGNFHGLPININTLVKLSTSVPPIPPPPIPCHFDPLFTRNLSCKMRFPIAASVLFVALALARSDPTPEAEVGDMLITRADLACGRKGKHCAKGVKWCKAAHVCIACSVPCPMEGVVA